MWLGRVRRRERERERERELGSSRLNTSQSSHCAVRLPGRVCFLREEEAVQINRQHSQGSLRRTELSAVVSLPLSLSLSLSLFIPRSPTLVQQAWISLWDGLRFSQQCCLFACLGQPTYVAHSRKRVNSPFLLLLFPHRRLFLFFSVCLSVCLFIFLVHFLPHTKRWCFGGSPPRAYTLRVELFLYGELRLIAVQGPGLIQRLPCSEAPRFLN